MQHFQRRYISEHRASILLDNGEYAACLYAERRSTAGLERRFRLRSAVGRFFPSRLPGAAGRPGATNCIPQPEYQPTLAGVADGDGVYPGAIRGQQRSLPGSNDKRRLCHNLRQSRI